MSYLKNEISKKSKWYLSKHRYLELVHFCLQYPEWKQKLREIDILQSRVFVSGNSEIEWSDETYRLVDRRDEWINKIEIVERLAREVDPVLASYILLSVTTGMAFPQMQARHRVPYGKDIFYNKRREFFWRLDKINIY